MINCHQRVEEVRKDPPSNRNTVLSQYNEKDEVIKLCVLNVLHKDTRSAYVFCAVNSAVFTTLWIVRGEQSL